MAVTQNDIARHLGINQKSVSIAFGASGRIADVTRERILRAARQLGYRPNHLAAGLRGARTRSVGVIWAFVDPWAGDAVIALDVLNRVQGRGFAAYQAQRIDDPAVLCRQIDDFLARRVDAIVIQSIPSLLRNEQLAERLLRAPAVVAVAREAVEPFRGDMVIHDRDAAIRQVVAHFAKTGRKRPAMALDMQQESNPPKFEAFRDECRRQGIAEHAKLILDLGRAGSADQHGRLHSEAFHKHFAKRIDVDAIFCFNDIGALAMMHELADRGVSVPDDVAVVGFNNTEAGALWRPALATGDRKFSVIAEAVDRMLASRLETPDQPPQREVVHCEFVWRESAG